MGSGQSIPNKLTRQSVYDLTKSTRDVMNVLLEYMLKEISIRDFYLLSNPTECKKYVLFMANNMYKQFYELGITPSKDKKGVLVFRPIKELVEVPESEKAERQSLCLILSYFYTRIFQIFGALALTLIDDASIMSDKGLLLNTSDKSRLLAPGTRPYIASGGALPDFGIYNYIKPYILSESVSAEYGYRTKSPKYVIYFRKGASDKLTLSYNATFSIGYKGAQRFFYLDISSRPQDIENNDILVQLKRIRYTKKGESIPTSIDIPLEVVDSKSFHVISDRKIVQGIGRYTTSYRIRDSSLTIPEYFEELFDKLVPYISALMQDDIPYLTSYSGTKQYLVSERDVTEELRLERVIRNLTKEKPLGHCVARAMQLLRTLPMKGVDGESNICKARFLETREGVSRSGIPLPGSTLDTSPGITALSQLFYDTVQYGSPKVGMSNESIAKYTEFMRSMAIIFGDNTKGEQPRSNSDLRDSGLKGIHNKRDRELCTGRSGDIRVPEKYTFDVYQVVNQLYKKQLEHSSKAGAIFKMLFDIQRDKSSGRFRIMLNENILKKGVPEINRINSIARDVLVDYYKNCELLYVNGMKIVLDSAGTKV